VLPAAMVACCYSCFSETVLSLNGCRGGQVDRRHRWRAAGCLRGLPDCMGGPSGGCARRPAAALPQPLL
jgi:hypothetical protein